MGYKKSFYLLKHSISKTFQMPNSIIFKNPSFKQVMPYKIKAKTELTKILLLRAVILLLISKVKLETECKKFHNWGIEKAFKHLIQAMITN